MRGWRRSWWRASASRRVTDAAAPGSTPWSYSVNDADLDFLDDGETITFSYTVTATDNSGATATDTVSFTITGTNDDPVAANDLWVISTNTTARFTTSALNDFDLDGDHLTYQLPTLTNDGRVLTLNPDGTISYMSASGDADKTDDDFFDYTVTDGITSVTARVYVDWVNANSGFDLATDYVNDLGPYTAAWLDAGGGPDEVTGGEGLDFFIGAGGNDVLIGGLNGDVLRGGDGNDEIDGEGGPDDVDLIDFSDATGGTGITFLLVQSSSNTVFVSGLSSLDTDTYRNIEGVIGTNFNDTLGGSSSADVLIGANGKDTLTGNAGADKLTYRAPAESLVGANRDVVTDFEVGTDKIDLSAMDAKTQVGFSGDQEFTFVENLSPAINPGVQANSITWYQTGGNTIVQGDVNGDTTADFEIQLTGLKALTANDFSL